MRRFQDPVVQMFGTEEGGNIILRNISKYLTIDIA